jgi:hypothetical protein
MGRLGRDANVDGVDVIFQAAAPLRKGEPFGLCATRGRAALSRDLRLSPAVRLMSTIIGPISIQRPNVVFVQEPESVIPSMGSQCSTLLAKRQGLRLERPL